MLLFNCYLAETLVLEANESRVAERTVIELPAQHAASDNWQRSSDSMPAVGTGTDGNKKLMNAEELTRDVREKMADHFGQTYWCSMDCLQIRADILSKLNREMRKRKSS